MHAAAAAGFLHAGGDHPRVGGGGEDAAATGPRERRERWPWRRTPLEDSDSRMGFLHASSLVQGVCAAPALKYFAGQR